MKVEVVGRRRYFVSRLGRQARQAARVGVLGVLEDVQHVAVLDQVALEHHGDVVGDLGDHARGRG